MKRFDKGYIYSFLLSDLFSSFVILFILLKDLFIGEDASFEEFCEALPILAIVYLVVYLCFIAYRIMYYRTSGYELTEKEIKCNRGVLFRKRSVLDYTKIHAINKKQTLIDRIFGVAVLTVDSGSTNTSHQAEIIIIEKAATVDALLKELNALKEGGVRTAEPEKEEVLLSPEDSLFRFTSKRKMLYTLINIVTTAFFTVLFSIFAMIVLGVGMFLLQLEIWGNWVDDLIFLIIISVLVMLLLSIISFITSMLQSFIGYHNFTITRQGQNIQISYGLLERHTNTFSYDRIKAVKISQGLVQRMLGFAVIKLEVIGYTLETGDDNNNADLGVLVPFCKYDEIGELLGKILPDYVPEEKQTKAVSYFPFISWFACILAIVTGTVLLSMVALMLVFQAPYGMIIGFAFAGIIVAMVILMFKVCSAAFSYHNNGLAATPGKITAYYGGFTKNITVFLTKNLIAAENVTTPMRKKAGIVSLVMHLKTNAASNEIKVHIQDEELSESLEEMLIL